MEAIINMLNTVRDNATSEYQNRIPEATRTNMDAIRYAMLDEDNIMVANEFMSTILNKLVKSVVHTKRFENPLKALKKGKKPLGDTIEEIYNNFLKGEEHDPSGAKLLERKLPDTKTVYHRMNLQMQYPVTVSREKLSRAFASYEALDSYIQSIINSLYNSAELDEFMNMKELVRSALEANALKIVELSESPLASEDAAKGFIKQVKSISRLMTFPSADWNAYLTAQSTDTKPIVTFSRKDEQVLIIDAVTDTSIAVDVLASTFNMSVAEFNDTKKIVIDAFPAYEVDGVKHTIHTALLDEAFFQVWDDFYAITKFNNGQGIYDNYYLNVWQTMAFSPLVNGVAVASE